uniref:Transient receptor potential cation channel subfamily M member 3 n=3 Tax=Magallana gigas TaxID=29159 RepID=A0A8W8NPQ1_MAGGI|nr:transient receptor potential cation channel subfamily M member 2-like isoform X2 [Crassostrea gigas]
MASTSAKDQQDDFDVPRAWEYIRTSLKGETPVRNTNGNQTVEDLEVEPVQSFPTMVFSVIGDSDNFVPRPWPKTVFQTALIEAAKSGGETWILYRGKEHGVSKVVRDAYKSYEDIEFKTTAFEKLINDVDRHVKLIRIAGEKTTSEITQENNSTLEKTEVAAELKTNIGDGNSFLLKFEKFVSEQEVAFFSQKMDTKMPVPVAIIVCEGDFKTIEHIAHALENKLPVIIMKGSGMAADLVSERLENPELSLKKKASILFGIQVDDTEYTDLKNDIEYIVESRDLVGVFDLERDDPLMLSNIIGEAIVSCWSIENIFKRNRNIGIKQKRVLQQRDSNSDTDVKNLKKNSIASRLLRTNFVGPQLIPQLIIPLFDEIKESRPFILNPKYSTPTSLPLYFFFGYQLLQESDQLGPKLMKLCGPILLLEALKANRCDYVRVLLDQGVNFDRQFLPELYEQTVSCVDCDFQKDDSKCLHMQWILKQIQIKEADNLCNRYKFLMKKKKNPEFDWTGEHEKKLLKLPKKVVKAGRHLCRKMLCYKEDKGEKENKNTNEEVEGYNAVRSTDPMYLKISDILLWAIFANRRELAEICWLKGTDQLLTGLICSAMLKKLSKKANNVKEQVLAKDLEEHSRLFEQRCLKMMDSMYEEDAKHAIDLMDNEAVVWGIHSSPLTFAYENFMYDIVAHTCSQKYINKKWYNELAPDLNPFFKSIVREPVKFFTAPLTKYLFNYTLFFSMLAMYSAFVLTSVSTKYYELNIGRVFEYYVYFWGAGDLIEELISCFGCLEAEGRSHRSYYSRMKRYLYDFWNLVDLLSYALLLSALFVRHFYIDETFTIARRMFALSLLVMYLRFLEVFLIHRTLGPTLIMIKEMLKDLLGFLSIAVFVVLGVGIYYHANLWPDHQTIWSGDWTNWRIWTILYYPYWQLYGELNLDNLDGSVADYEDRECTNITAEWESDPSKERCPHDDWTVQAIAAFYLLFSNLLLVNLVIAMFSYTFERVQENSEKLWRFERYTVINDYEWRIPSPINIIFLPYRFLCCPMKKNGCLHKCRENFNKEEMEAAEKREKADMKYQRNFQKVIALRNQNKI